jgi:low temperature requirement protein LtrA
MGLFTIIVFGESFIKVIGGFSGHDIEFERLIVALVGLVVVGSLWWVYFQNVAERAVNWARGAQIWVYMHLPLQIGLVALAVGVYKLVTLHEEGLPDKYRLLISGSVALALVATSVIELWTVKDNNERRTEFYLRIAGAVAAVLIGLFGGGLNEMVVLLLLAAICLAQVAFDLIRRTEYADVEVEHEIEV